MSKNELPYTCIIAVTGDSVDDIRKLNPMESFDKACNSYL
jgi:hypothetical protein